MVPAAASPPSDDAELGTGTRAQELAAKARAMIPALKERSAQAVADRCLPVQTIQEMQEAGFFRVFQPKRYGGFELDPQAFFDIQTTLAEGCMSTGWVYGVLGVHPFQLALFDARAPADVWAKDSSTLVSSSYQPVGKVERVDGGWEIPSKRYPYPHPRS